MKEDDADKLARLQLMAEDERGVKWDLSENDRSAIEWALESLSQDAISRRAAVNASFAAGLAHAVKRLREMAESRRGPLTAYDALMAVADELEREGKGE